MLLPFWALSQQDSHGCPFGDSNDAGHRSIDSMKNRFTVPVNYIPVDFDSYAAMTITDDYSYCGNAISINGTVLEIQDGGMESCNCHSKVYKDTHIYLVKDASVTDKSQAIIVEVTPAFRQQMGTTDNLKKWVGKDVTIYGYAFQDQEHKANSTVDNGNGDHWRHTTWEIHPITNIAGR